MLFASQRKQLITLHKHALREKCPNMEFFLVHIFRIQTEYGQILIKREHNYFH